VPFDAPNDADHSIPGVLDVTDPVGLKILTILSMKRSPSGRARA
jgi:hypothetical protein